MQLHHLSGPQGEQVLRESAIWDDISQAMDEKRAMMGPHAMAIISVLSPSEDQSMIVVVDGYMTHLSHYLNVLVLDEITPEEYADAEFLMDRLRKTKMLDSQKMLIAHGGLPMGMKQPANPSLN
jgi:hypothetical protein